MRPFHLLSASAASVPSTTAANVAPTATCIVLPSACQISRSLKSSLYHLKVKPFHAPLKRDALKELTTRTTIGT